TSSSSITRRRSITRSLRVTRGTCSNAWRRMSSPICASNRRTGGHPHCPLSLGARVRGTPLHPALHPFAPLYLLGERGDDLVKVAHDAQVREAEDGGVGVFVDGDDRAGGLHADLVLDFARDADGDIELGADRLAGLADLVGVGYPAHVHDRAGGGY